VLLWSLLGERGFEVRNGVAWPALRAKRRHDFRGAQSKSKAPLGVFNVERLLIYKDHFFPLQ
jgi:hypothetical protein